MPFPNFDPLLAAFALRLCKYKHDLCDLDTLNRPYRFAKRYKKTQDKNLNLFNN